MYKSRQLLLKREKTKLFYQSEEVFMTGIWGVINGMTKEILVAAHCSWLQTLLEI